MESNEKNFNPEEPKITELVFTLPDLEQISYENHSLENLVDELQRLLKNASIQRISNHVSAIKLCFDTQFNQQLEAEKEAFLQQGNTEIDFEYHPLIKKQFDELFK